MDNDLHFGGIWSHVDCHLHFYVLFAQDSFYYYPYVYAYFAKKFFRFKVLYQDCRSTCHLPCTYSTDPIPLYITSLKHKRRI